MTARTVRLVLSILSLCATLLPGANEQPNGARNGDTLRILMDPSGRVIWIRHPFKADEDLVLRVGKGGPSGVINFFKARLLPSAAEMTAETCESGTLIHACADDSTPWRINGTHIGANHGPETIVQVQADSHGKTTSDIGSSWTDNRGVRFHLMAIPDANTLWFSSDNTGSGDVWKFQTSMSGKVLHSVRDGSELPFSGSAKAQLHPSSRIGRQEFLADGVRPLAPGGLTECRYLEIIEEYDIINPASVVEDVLRRPGKEPEFTAERQEAVIANRIIYRIYPNGATTISHTAKALQTFELGFMGFIQSLKLERGRFDTHECSVPKSAPFVRDGIAYDFRGLQDFRTPPLSNLVFSAAENSVQSGDDLPNRFLQFLGTTPGSTTKRAVGFVIGYSPLRGMTALTERSRYTGSAGRINDGTAKLYPYALDPKAGSPVAAGTEFACEAYRQYFDPSAFPHASAVYWHRDGDCDLITIDYLGYRGDDTLMLPAAFKGKHFEIVEKSRSVTVHSFDTNGGPKVSLSVSDGSGYLVLKASDGRSPSTEDR